MRAIQIKFCLLLACPPVLAALSSVSAAETAPQKATANADDKTVWVDCKNLVVEGKGWTETQSFYDRLPAKAEGKVTPSVWGLSHHSAGMCVPFTSDAPSIQVRWTLLPNGSLSMPHMPATGVSGVDLYSQDNQSGRWSFVANGRPAAVTNTAKFTPPAGQPCLLYLPLYNGVTSVEIGIPQGSTLAGSDPAAIKHRKPIVIYGTSITQGGCASRPGMVHTAILGRRLDLPVINLGFSGSGRMEAALAECLAQLDPSVYVLDCLPNMSAAELTERVEPFVRTLRQAHPDTPILLVEDRTYANAFIIPGTRARNDTSRAAHMAAYERLLAAGVTGLHYLAGEDLLGNDGEGTVDGSHPTDLGFVRQADAMEKALRPLVGR